jgi:hypothetical protein
MKNPLWDIPLLVKPKLEPVLAYRKTSLGKTHHSVKIQASTIPNIQEKHKELNWYDKGKTQTSYFYDTGKQKFLLLKLRCNNFCTNTNKHYEHQILQV